MFYGLWAQANAEPLQIAVWPPGVGARALNMELYTFQLSGGIDRGAAKRLEDKIKAITEKEARLSFYLNSPGGNVLEGMEIGRLIRSYGMSVNIGVYRGEQEDVLAGSCYSACALAFLGGPYRYLQQGSTYGVHRFSGPGATPHDLELGQIMSASVGSYIREMDVDPKLFDFMSIAGKDEMNVLTRQKMKELNVLNDGRARPKWAIEVVTGAVYLRGEQDTVYGKGRLLVACGRNGEGAVAQSYVSAGNQLASILAGSWVHSLLIDGKTVPVEKPKVLLDAKNGYLMAMVDVSTKQAARMASAKSLGHAIQKDRETALYVGYQIDIPELDRQRVKTFFTNCAKGY